MRITKYLLIGLLLCGCTTAFSQALPGKQEQFNFLKWYVTYKRLVPLDDTSISVPSHFIVPDRYDINRILLDSKQSKASRSYIKRQARLLNQPLILDSTTLKKISWYKANTNGDMISVMSLPVFSTDRKLAIVGYGFYCCGDCGHEGTDVFIKDKHNQWIPAKVATKVIMF